LTLVAPSDASFASLNIINNNKKGVSIVGGESITGNSATKIGVYNSTADAVYPAINIYDTSNGIYDKTHISLNRNAIDNSYTFHLNGNTTITNQEITHIKNASFEIKNVVCNNSNQNIMIAFGTLTTISGETPQLKYLYTDNGGKAWIYLSISNDVINTNTDRELLYGYIDDTNTYFATSTKVFFRIGNGWSFNTYTNIKGIHFMNNNLYILDDTIIRILGSNNEYPPTVSGGMIGYGNSMYIYGNNTVYNSNGNSNSNDLIITHSTGYTVNTVKKYNNTVLSLAYLSGNHEIKMFDNTTTTTTTITISSSQISSQIKNIEFISSDALIAITDTDIYYSNAPFSYWKKLDNSDLNGGGTADLLINNILE
jgi:hypothetical protein